MAIAAHSPASPATRRLRAELYSVCTAYGRQLLVTYALFNVENWLRLAQPLLLGWAINDLLRQSHTGLIVFALGHLLHLGIRWLRQIYDTRTFTRIHAERATAIVVRQRSSGVNVSSVSARSMLSQEYIDFFERHIPMMFRTGYSLLGALAMLAWFDPLLIAFCLLLLLPAGLLNLVHGRRSLRFSQGLHDGLEDEISVVQRAAPEELSDHYRRLANWRVKLSDSEAWTAGLMELFVLAVMVASLVRFCASSSVAPGDIVAVFRYVLLFVMGLDQIPTLVQQVSRLRDIQGRLGG